MYIVKRFKRRKVLCSSALVLAVSLAFTLLSCVPVLAYYNQGTVQLALGAVNVQVKKEEVVSVAAFMTPASSDQTLGCRMPECPQSCGESGCGDANGQCTCAGTDYTKYNAGVELTSSNAAIATAEWKNGVINITGVSMGTATIYAKGILRQYTNSPEQSITVTVTAQGIDSSGGGSSSGGASPSSGGSSSTGGTPSSGGSPSTGRGSSSVGSVEIGSGGSRASTESQETQQSSSDEGETQGQGETEAPVSRVSGGRGTFDIIVLDDDAGKTGKKELERIKGQDVTAVFQHKDTSGNVLYSWSINGNDIKDSKDIDMKISFTSKYKSQIQKLGRNIEDIFYLSFAHSGELPGKSRIDIKVGDNYKNGETLMLYLYDEKDNTISIQEKNLVVTDGYVSFEITHCSEYFLTTKTIEKNKTGSILPWIIAAIAVVCAAALGGFFIWKKRKGTEKYNYKKF